MTAHSLSSAVDRQPGNATPRTEDQQGSVITLTKVQVSELAVATVLTSLRACGLSGYRNDTEFTIGRLLRDVLSAPIMISNDRILTNLATTSLMTPLPASISG